MSPCCVGFFLWAASDNAGGSLRGPAVRSDLRLWHRGIKHGDYADVERGGEGDHYGTDVRGADRPPDAGARGQGAAGERDSAVSVRAGDGRVERSR